MSNRVYILIALAGLLVLGHVSRSPGESQATDRAQRRAQVGALLSGAQDYLAAEQYDSAMVNLEAVLALEPSNQDAYYYIAASHLVRADTSSAMAALAEGMSKAPMSSRLRLLSARLHITSGEYGEAEVLVTEILRFKPNNAEALYIRGMVKLAQADTTGTLADWEAALQKATTGGKKR